MNEVMESKLQFSRELSRLCYSFILAQLRYKVAVNHEDRFYINLADPAEPVSTSSTLSERRNTWTTTITYCGDSVTQSE